MGEVLLPPTPVAGAPGDGTTAIRTRLYAEWVKTETYAIGYLEKEGHVARRRSALLWTSTAFSAVVGTAVFASLGTSVHTPVRVLVACVSLAAAVLTGWAKLTEPGIEVGKCQAARLGYGELREKAGNAYDDLVDGAITPDAARKVRDELLAGEGAIKRGEPPVLSDEEWDAAAARASEHAKQHLGPPPA